MNIASASDERYLPGLLVTWGSILASSSSAYIHFYLLHDGLSDELIDGFESRLRKHRSGFKLTALLISTDSMVGLPEFFFDSRMTYARLLLPSLIDVDRVIYIDVDLLCLRGVDEVWSHELNNQPIGVVEEYEYTGVDFEVIQKYSKNSKAHRYFNGGLLLLDLVKIRAEGSFTRCFEVLEKSTDLCKYYDQSALNAVFACRCSYMNTNLNFQLHDSRICSVEQLDRLVEGECNIHYITSFKPWIAPSSLMTHRLFCYCYAFFMNDEGGMRELLQSRGGLFASIKNALSFFKASALKRVGMGGAHIGLISEAHHRSMKVLWREWLHNKQIAAAFRRLRSKWDRNDGSD